MKYVMGIDAGTTSLRACLFDENGMAVSSSMREYKSYYPQPGYVEQDINEIIESFYASCKQAIKLSGVNIEDIAGVSFSTYGTTMVLLDEKENIYIKLHKNFLNNK